MRSDLKEHGPAGFGGTSAVGVDFGAGEAD